MTPPGPFKAGDLDVVGKLFGIRFRDGGSWGLAEIYIEDDELYHFKCAVDQSWLDDLARVAGFAIELRSLNQVSGASKDQPPWERKSG